MIATYIDHYIVMIEYLDIQPYKLDPMDESINKTFADTKALKVYYMYITLILFNRARYQSSYFLYYFCLSFVEPDSIFCYLVHP